ncbi:Poly(U)-binding-splicing factor PUF60 [Aphelenchoides fujianensis]|nr:Poly(U)-binding-splicing factor PUF60 [Aphelenchoides fujianensis]
MAQNGGTAVMGGAMPLLQQSGQVFVGPGAKNDAQVIGLGLTSLTSRQKDDLERAKRYAMEQSIKHVLMKQQVAHQQNQQKVTMYAQALSLMSRVYIGSISFEIREDNLKSQFACFGPIKSINMSWDSVTGHHKGFAFLEYEVPEAALLAQETMNGKLMGGRNLKVGRPSNMPQAQPIIEMVTQEAKQYHRVYVASVHPDLSEGDLRSVFEAFGTITKVQLAKQAGGRGHRGFGYLEFQTAQAVKEAIEGMSNFDLGGQFLQVGRCITPPDALTYIVPSTQDEPCRRPPPAAAAAITAKIQAQEVTGQKPDPPKPKKPEAAVPRGRQAEESAPPAPVPVEKEKAPVPPKRDLISKIKIKQTNPMQKATFAPLPDLLAPKEETFEEGTSGSADGQLMITAGANSTALALRGESTELAKIKNEKPTASGQQSSSKSGGGDRPKRKRAPKAAKERKPKLNSKGAMSAVYAAGAINDQIQAAHQANEEATLASLEHVEIRGNDARHMLMHKLMRTNRSTVILLKNMVDIDEVDDDLEGEVREECEEVTIVKEESANEVRIFVRFADPTQAEAAVKVNEGRFFGGRTISAKIYDQVLFEHDDFTG